jgi:hypothetical protein
MVFRCLFISSICALTLGAQSSVDQPTENAPVTEAPAPTARVLGVLPNFRTVEDTGVYQPITAHQKFVIATKDTLDYPLMIVGLGFAGLTQLTNEHPDFGQGTKGFAHRWATAYADQFVGNYMTEGILPMLFRQDPRYFRRGAGHGGVLSRTAYAASRIVITRNDSGRHAFNFSEVLGNGISAAVGNAYYPAERTAGDNLSRLSTQLATDAFSQILKEFWPDVKRKLAHRR